jgi:hypothetical protein
VLVGAPLEAPTEALERILTDSGPLSFISAVCESRIRRKSIIFEFEDVASQRKLALRPLVYDRNFALAVVRQDEAIAAGFISCQDEKFSVGIAEGKTPGRSRAVWLCGFNTIQPGLEADFVREVRDVCDGFGDVKALRLIHVNKDALVGIPGIFSDNEPVVIVEFSTQHAAYCCKRYIRGASCFFLSEARLGTESIDLFEPLYDDVQTPVEAHPEIDEVEAPLVKGGKIVSAEVAIIEANKTRKPTKLAPEEMEIID